MSQEPITTYCPACGKAFRVPPDLNGKKILCKACQTHFVVQADRPGLPAAPPPPAPARAAAPPQAAHSAAPPKVPSAPTSNPPVTAATAAPVAVPPPPTDALAPIPFDDAPVPDSMSVASLPSVSKPKELGKVKIESKGPYFVIKLVTAGKMIHVNIENVLNEHAADGWKLEQIISVSGDAYAILSRFNGQPGQVDHGSHG
jgi:hypothetical protein